MRKWITIKASWLTVVFGFLLLLGVGVLCRPMVHPRPIVDATGMVILDGSGKPMIDPESEREVARMMRPYDVATCTGGTILLMGLIGVMLCRKHQR
jgi:hypothetical protein